MTTYVLGAGASFHAGYPFVKSMGRELLEWMKLREGYPILSFRGTVEALEKQFGDVSNIEVLLNRIDNRIARRATDYSLFANCYKPALVQALREWFGEIHRQDRAKAYRLLAEKVLRPGDCIITFNYDVSLDQELKRVNLWTLGDGYGFQVQDFEQNSPVKLLKLRGSINWFAGIQIGASGGPVALGPVALGPRGLFGCGPVFCDADLQALGYEGEIDSSFPREGLSGIPPLILPTNRKRFYFDTSLGIEWKPFWNSLWSEAEGALRLSERIVICGYGLSPTDKRGCKLLLNGRLRGEIEVCCAGDTDRIVGRLQSPGRQVRGACEQLFEPWVEIEAARR